ncbi:MAG: class I SAM-dependent methyltransferase [Clostridia bacterium]|nr:class I SAM-dependent methyltransferase [Clostridia bacterium]
MELKGRLKLIADMVPHCNKICDIGTDHAYIPIYLVLKNKCMRAIAADVRKGPVEAAERNIKQYKLDSVIETRIGDGLQPIEEGEADIIVIAGMGGVLINKILTEGFNKAKASKALILQAMNAIELVREWLYKNGFEIFDESLIDEGEKIYNVIAAKWTGNTEYVDDPTGFLVGRKLVEKKDPLLKKYINKKIILLIKINEGLKNSENMAGEIEKNSKLIEKLQNTLKVIEI